MKYLCPECRAVLNPTESIVLVGHRGVKRGLFLFQPRPGAYDYTVGSGLDLKPEERWEFCCPICHTDLTTHYSDKLAHLRLEDDGAEFLIVFSKVASQHSTFMLTREDGAPLYDELNSYLEFSLKKHYW